MYPKPWLTVKHTYNLDASVLPARVRPTRAGMESAVVAVAVMRPYLTH